MILGYIVNRIVVLWRVCEVLKDDIRRAWLRASVDNTHVSDIWENEVSVGLSGYLVNVFGLSLLEKGGIGHPCARREANYVH